MQAAPIEVGATFGRLKIIGPGASNKGRTRVHVSCACGVEKDVDWYDVRHSKIVSCGCLHRERFIFKKHGLTPDNGDHHPLYNTWVVMKQRCYNPKHPKFAAYGARGIVVCERWREDFTAFIADMGERPRGTTLDRRENDGPYAPENCRWATRSQQNRNKRPNVMLTWNGITLCVRDWSTRLGIGASTLSYRIRAGWNVEAALTTPASFGNRRV